MLRSLTIAFTLLALQLVAGDTQVRVGVRPGEHRPNQYMTGFIQIRGTEPITVCIDVEGDHRGDRQRQPWPFSVERFQHGEWAGQGFGSRTSAHTQVLHPGPQFGFPFTLPEPGQYRLVLQYWPGDNPKANCRDFGAGNQQQSKTFQVTD